MTTAWLRDLEEKVQEASTRLREVRQQNDELVRRNEELEQNNATLSQQTDELNQKIKDLEEQVAASPAGDEAAAWAEERDAIRQRVEKLASHLGELLDS